MALDRNDIASLTQAFENALKNRGSGGFSAQPAKPIDFSLNPLKNTAAAAGTALSELKDAAKNSLGTFRDLAKNGSTFSNDLIGMSMAAANSRMSLDEFADVISKNGKDLSGLGSSVSSGTEAFAKFSKGFFDSKFDTELRSLGFTSKELNEVMAIHIGNVRSSAALDDEGRKKEYEAARKLAIEMDATSKLMGKNREIQMEEAKARQADMQVQAKIRSESQKMRAEGLAAGKDPKQVEAEISAYKAAVDAALKKATDQGAGQAAKEMFATNTVTSQTGAIQASMMQGQVSAIRDEIKAARRGDAVGIEDARARATAEAVKNQNDPVILSTMALGDAVGDLAGPLNEAGKALFTFQSSLEKIALEKNLDLSKVADQITAIKIAQDSVKATKPGTKEGVLEGALAIEQTGQEIRAGAARAADAIGKGGESIADQLRKTGATIAEVTRNIAGPGRTLAEMIGDKAALGLKPETVERRPGEGTAAFEKRQSEASGGAIGTVMQGAFKISETLLGEINKGIIAVGDALKDSKSSTTATQMPPAAKEVPLRNKGSLESVGKLFEDFGQGTLVELHGMESVMRPEDLENLVQSSIGGLGKGLSKLTSPPEEGSKSSFAESMAASVKKGMQTISVDPNIRRKPTGGMDGFDLSSISKDISTTISSVTGGSSTTTKQVQNDDSKAAEAEMKTLSAKFKEDQAARRAIVQEGMAVEDRKFSKVQAALKLDEETIKIKEAYEKRREELAKKVADGTTWEIENKQSSAEETKKIIESEILTKAQFTDKLQSDEKKIADIRAKFGSEAAETHAQEVEQKRQSLESTKVMIKDELSSTKSIIGKSVEGLTDDMIESMLPEGSILEDYYVDINGKLQSFVDDSAAVMKDSISATGTYLTDLERKNAALKAAEKQGSTKVSEAAPGEIKNPMLNDKGKINLNKLNLPGMSNFGSALAPKDPKGTDTKGAAASISEEAKKAEAAKTEAAKKAEAAKTEAAKTAPVAKPPVNAQKVASLDDVVKSLDRLNIQMGQLIIQQSDLIKKQTTTMLSAGSSNIYDRTR